MSIQKTMIFLGLFCGAAFSGDTASGSLPATPAKAEFTVVNVDKFQFSYKVEGDRLVAQVSYPTNGWVAVGFNPVKVMLGANFIIGCVADGKPVVSDEFGITKYSHAPDTAQGGKNDITNANVITEKGTTTMSFSIPLNSGDAKDVVLEKGKPIKVIFAEGKKPNIKSGHNEIGKTTITLQ
jgi:hypothetical protein